MVIMPIQIYIAHSTNIEILTTKKRIIVSDSHILSIFFTRCKVVTDQNIIDFSILLVTGIFVTANSSLANTNSQMT